MRAGHPSSAVGRCYGAALNLAISGSLAAGATQSYSLNFAGVELQLSLRNDDAIGWMVWFKQQ